MKSTELKGNQWNSKGTTGKSQNIKQHEQKSMEVTEFTKSTNNIRNQVEQQDTNRKHRNTTNSASIKENQRKPTYIICPLPTNQTNHGQTQETKRTQRKCRNQRTSQEINGNQMKSGEIMRNQQNSKGIKDIKGNHGKCLLRFCRLHSGASRAIGVARWPAHGMA